MNRSLAGVICAGIVLTAFGAQAQNPQAAPPGATQAPMAPSNAPSPPPEKIAPPDRDVQRDQRTLSDKLAEQHGMLQPPRAVDPGMAVQPPAQSQGTMPVIPPPGSPGGNQRVVPK